VFEFGDDRVQDGDLVACGRRVLSGSRRCGEGADGLRADGTGSSLIASMRDACLGVRKALADWVIARPKRVRAARHLPRGHRRWRSRCHLSHDDHACDVAAFPGRRGLSGSQRSRLVGTGGRHPGGIGVGRPAEATGVCTAFSDGDDTRIRPGQGVKLVAQRQGPSVVASAATKHREGLEGAR
jgi:hypothetical protein